MIALIGIIIVLLALMGAPLFSILGSVAILCFYLADISLAAIVIEMYRIASAPTLLTIPLFTFAGYIMAESNTPKRIVDLSRAFLGWLPGGLAIVALFACAFFTAFTGASGVTIIAMGGLMFPILLKENYQERFALGLLTAGGSRGLLFPPSLPLILFGLVAGTSIDKLFVAGFLPGMVTMIVLMIYCIYTGKINKVTRQKFKIKECWRSFRAAIWEVPLPFIILGGIYGGFFTASEAAAVTAFYVLIVEVFIYRDINLFKDMPVIIRDSMVLVGGILVILGTAMGLTNYLIDEEIPMKILAMMKTYISSKIMFLVVLNVFLLIVGCLMDIFSAIIVVVPLITPIAVSFGVDPVHLGIIFLTNLEIGYSTPPVGINLFVASYRFQRPVVSLYRATLPFLLLMMIALIIITYVPQVSLFLVEYLGIQ